MYEYIIYFWERNGGDKVCALLGEAGSFAMLITDNAKSK
jgi:hypothetical protein